MVRMAGGGTCATELLRPMCSCCGTARTKLLSTAAAWLLLATRMLHAAGCSCSAAMQRLLAIPTNAPRMDCDRQRYSDGCHARTVNRHTMRGWS
jgi:hypothetical protein